MFLDKQQIIEAVRSGFLGARALIVGDLMLDHYIWGDVTRISPEAPVPIVRVTRTSETAGGAGNVALNLAGLGLQVSLAGYVGNDDAGDRVCKLLNLASVDVSPVLKLDNRPTTTKTRIVGGHQQLVRCDVENCDTPDTVTRQKLMREILKVMAENVSVVVLSDYAKGVLHPEICRAIIAEGRRRQIPVLIDPKLQDFSSYEGATLLSPNRSELAIAAGVPAYDLDGLCEAGQRLRRRLNVKVIALTLSELGMALIESDSIRYFAATAKEVFDVSGAGDTVIATLAACVASTIGLDDASQLANLAAGVVVGKVGTVPIRSVELLAAISAEEASDQVGKICDLAEVQRRVQTWRTRRERIVFTNGCFDLLHAGHVAYLERARREGHRLVVGLNTDRSVRALKGEPRPLIPEHERARVLAALASVDAVILFDEDTPLQIIKALRPDVLAKGSDYSESQVVGATEVKSWGGNVALVPLVPGWSTSNIIDKFIHAERFNKPQEKNP